MPELITDLAIMLLTAGFVTVLFKKINQPLVLGYIAAGFLIGPYMPAFFTVADMESIKTWSEIGIIILMFGLGLEFNLHKLMQVGGTAIITAMTEVLGMLVVGFVVGQLLGWGIMESVFLGGMLSMSSTTIIIKAFDELGVRQEGFAQLVFGTLVVEDIAGIFMMIILSTVSVSQNISGGALALKLGMLVLYLALWLLIGIYVLPTVLKHTSRLMNDETLLIVSLGICFGMVLLAEALGFSSALGAFLAGSLLAGTVHSERVEHLTSGVKDLFGCVFFLSVGMLLDPAMVVKYALPILVISVVTIVGKLSISSLGVIFAGQPLKHALHCGCSLAQIGEFAFIIASLGMSLGVIADYLYPIIVSVSVITTLTTPFFIKSADKLYEKIFAILPEKLRTKLDRYTDEDAQSKREEDSDWGMFLRRYLKVTALYGAIMLGIGNISLYLLMPFIATFPLEGWLSKAITLVIMLLGIGLFVRPMMDRRSPEFTRLWLKSNLYRLPLLALNGIRLLLIATLILVPVQRITGIGSFFLLPIAVVLVLLASRSGRLASAYLSVEARFLANFNERQLQQRQENDNTEWLDEKLLVAEIVCGEESEAVGKTLITLNWGKKYGVNVVQIQRDKRYYNMPSGYFTLHKGDRLYVIGEEDGLCNLCTICSAVSEEFPSLRTFTAAQPDGDNALYAFALAVDKDSELSGKTIRETGLRDHYDCMVLGLQRDRLPILRPNVDMVIQPSDLIWVLGTRTMVSKLISRGHLNFDSSTADMIAEL